VTKLPARPAASDVSKQPGPKRPNQQGCKCSCQDQSQRHRCPSVRSIHSQTNRDPNRSRRRGAGHPIIRFVAGAERRRRLGAVTWWRLVAVDQRGGIRFRHRPEAVPAHDYPLVMLRGFQEYCLQPIMGGRPYRTGLPATSRLVQRFPYAMEQGINSAQQGICFLEEPRSGKAWSR
jgi:hypothetical protein